MNGDRRYDGEQPAGRAPARREPPVMCHLRGGDDGVVIADAEEP